MSAKPIPDGYHTITPYLSVHGVNELLTFLEKAFNAEIVSCLKLENDIVKNAEVKIGNSMLLIGEAPSGYHMPIMLYMYVPDVDAIYNQALAAGAKSVLAPVDQFYGDRSGAVEDSSGNQWWIATHKEDISPEELKDRMNLT